MLMVIHRPTRGPIGCNLKAFCFGTDTSQSQLTWQDLSSVAMNQWSLRHLVLHISIINVSNYHAYDWRCLGKSPRVTGMVQERKLQKELLYFPNKSTAQTAVSGFCSKKLYKQNSLYRQRRKKGVGERQEGSDLVISNKDEQLNHSQTMSVELMSFLNYCDKLQVYNLEMKAKLSFISTFFLFKEAKEVPQFVI